MVKRRVLLAGGAIVLGASAVSGVAIARGGDEHLRADLRGTNEVPPTDLDGRGRAKVTVDVDGGELCFSIHFRDTGTPSRGHIHVGAAGTNGGVVVPLFELAGMPADERHDALEQGRLRDCVPADPAVLQAIVEDPEGYYVNLHNARFPAGAVRGQLEG